MDINEFMRAIESVSIDNFDERHSVYIDGIKYYPLYIILYRNKSILGDTIRAVTKEEYSHSSIAFDTNMNQIYTFGNRIVTDAFGREKRTFGASIETLDKQSAGKFRYPAFSKIQIHCIYFTEEEMDNIKAYVVNIFNHPDDYKYNISGLVKYAFGKPSESETKMFCSQFVSSVLKIGANLNRETSLYSPVGLLEIENIIYVWEGFIGNFNKKEIDRRMSKISENVYRNKLVAVKS